MAEKYLETSDFGPYIYEDTDEWEVGVPMSASRTDGQHIVEEAPTHPHHVLRLEDVYSMGFKKHFLFGGF